ncbi:MULTISPECIES: ribonuclease HII [Psychrobacter]|uniref:ribonuclease HII n=1 Tax=Psychrobacter TaxID=497 RepID=UPI000AE19B04|nr:MULTISPECIES: ribonuclease HII [Psychrobacter]MBA6243192.1 ribonuclease HII [Psychrobacter sp. Urea-trap-18]MBA6286250.1 ribonuclease HII [Psychrobacter sp. Urea-trap-16]MBA6317399.1 ribonuclease HII [Psychrobacter sp. Urea-trap-20]MBA6334573.1 ribonuclease HII [Psychrobacter sp. Urea-trap-19]PKG60883.1 ribonuclease HII [Psychrobacter sp. Choline-3u-12]|tara:strand:+ start:139820 stop:140695 length:876 start_codon:yes stop_codon:yes gene_type:complete
MHIQHSTESSAQIIDINIEHIDVKGQYIQLAAPIRLYGQMNTAELLTQYLTNDNQEAEQSILQIGVDEAGRGPLLGSVNVAAAILPATWSGLIEEQPLKDTPLSILTDSKQLSEKKRDILYPLVQQHVIGYIIADIPAAVIDQVNILQATMLGMRLCTESLLEVIFEKFSTTRNDKSTSLNQLKIEVLFDGNRCPDLNYDSFKHLEGAPLAIDCQAWVKGDARHTSIAAASILAKVSRDETMYALDIQYPEYGIAKHKGYPTRAHMEAIEKYGVLPTHRRSFAPVRKMLET